MMTRRSFLAWPAALGAAAVVPQALGAHAALTLMLAGDVMTGRGIDQVLAHPSDPKLYESYLRSARDYVHLAERANGPIPRAVEPAYIWGEALEAIDARHPALRIVNLETAVTTEAEPWPDKGIHYRMHPDNVGCLTAARLDACVLANNHVLDWGRAGLVQTLATLHAAGLKTAGAGRDVDEAARPAVFELGDGQRLLLFALAAGSSGVPGDWAATPRAAGVHLLPDLAQASIDAIAAGIEAARAGRRSDRVIVSLHWGSNWGYRVDTAQRAFAHALIDRAGVDIVYGHSSHHPRPIEVHAGRLILYGCGDLINDYEGISGYEEFRGDLSLAYLPSIDPVDGHLVGLAMLPLQMHRFRLRRASNADVDWLRETLARECRPFGTAIEVGADGWLSLAFARR